VVKPSPRLPADGGPARGLLSIITWLIIIGLLVLFLMWWRGYLGGKDDVAVQSDDPAGIPAVQALPDDGDLVLPGTMDGAGGLRIPAPPRDVAQLTLDDDIRPPGPALSAVADGSTATSRIAPVIASPADAPSVPVDPVTDLTSPDEGAGPPSAPATIGQVVMTFTAPCWVDVRDSERQFKLFGEMPKGTQKVLGGTPPYKMVLGNARAVTITIDGVPYDLRPHAKGNVARFTLDP
jgi:cytoskeleton protein RodZ